MRSNFLWECKALWFKGLIAQKMRTGEASDISDASPVVLLGVNMMFFGAKSGATRLASFEHPPFVILEPILCIVQVIIGFLQQLEVMLFH